VTYFLQYVFVRSFFFYNIICKSMPLCITNTDASTTYKPLYENEFIQILNENNNLGAAHFTVMLWQSNLIQIYWKEKATIKYKHLFFLSIQYWSMLRNTMQFFTEECTSVYFNKSINSLCTYIVIYTYIYKNKIVYNWRGKKSRYKSCTYYMCSAWYVSLAVSLQIVTHDVAHHD